MTAYATPPGAVKAREFTEVIDPTVTGGARAVRFTPLPGGGVLAVDDQKRTRVYAAAEFYPDSGWHGRAFRLTKADGSGAYHVFLAHDGQNHHCDCAGQTYRPEGRCVHVAALLAVAANGWLPGDMANPEADTGPTEVVDAPF